VLALVCAAISAPMVLNSAGSRWEIASSSVFMASSLALVSSNFTAKASMPFTFAVVQPPDLGAEQYEAGDHHDEYGDDDKAKTSDGYLQLPS
jgi:hypothetical protein